MCGIVSLVYKHETGAMGHEAADLLKRLEYRGYDSTGASFIDRDRKIVVVKRVGAPSKVTKELNIPSYPGQRFIGQVRWATYGAVSDINSQPHQVGCKARMVGAHNGNISNTDSLKLDLGRRGHTVVSDNDGEIVVHLVEDHYADNKADPGPVLERARKALADSGVSDPVPDGVLLMVDAIRGAEAEADGSYAAAVADPELPGVFAIKSGSSLYAGMGNGPDGSFAVVSSDLGSVLAKTRMLIPLLEGQGLWYTHERWLVFSLHGELSFSSPALKRSRLNVRDAALDPRYQYFMEQEIRSAPANLDEIARYYFDDPADAPAARLFEANAASVAAVLDEASDLSSHADEASLADAFERLAARPAFRALAELAAPGGSARLRRGSFVSDEAQLYADLARLVPSRREDLALLDLATVWQKRRDITRGVAELKRLMAATRTAGGTVYVIASGTSYHAALTAAYFFGGLSGIAVHPCNPGQFRSAYMDCLGDADLILAVSQSGETKDLVDILQDVAERRPALKRVSLVNNENSRIPQELSDFYLPLLCGPEIAVAATKSFVNQLAVLYILAASFSRPAAETLAKVREAGRLIDLTLERAAPAIEQVAAELCGRPSIHLLGTGLIGLAREGALKIREVALNHSEGYDAAEFKHGPNTILGKNTVFSLREVELAMDAALACERGGSLPRGAGAGEILRSRREVIESLFSDYPLVFVCPPDERDIRITISQIHTHKIRGASIFLFAEKREDLEAAAGGIPAGNGGYRSAYVELPASGDRFLFVFAATAALQYLAFRMSVLKMRGLDALGVAGHGVHPDAPKNVSKSITVD